MQRPPSRIFAINERCYVQYVEDNLWYPGMVRSYNAQHDTYVLEFEGSHNTQVCHASQMYPMIEAAAVSAQGSPMLHRAEGAEGSLPGLAVPAAEKERKQDRLQKLSSFDKQKGAHTRQLRKIQSIDSQQMQTFKREEKLAAMNKFAMPSVKTSRLLAVHNMGPSRIPPPPLYQPQGSSDVDSESSSSAMERPLPGKTLDEVLAQAPLKQRLLVMFRSPAAERGGPRTASESLTESSEDSFDRPPGESGALLDVPVSGSRSLRVRASKKLPKASELFQEEAEADKPAGQANLEQLLEGFNPRNISPAKDLKMKRGSQSLLNLVRLSRQHHTTLEEETRESTLASVELSVGNRCASGSETVMWTLFVEQLHVTNSSIESVSFGPLPPKSEVVTVRAAPFSLTRESSRTFLEAMDLQVRIVVNFVGGEAPAVFHHDLSVPGSWCHFEVDAQSGSFRQMAPPIAESEVEDPRIAIEVKVREAMAAESVKQAEEVMRIADKVGKQILLEPVKKSRGSAALVSQLRPRIRAFLVRGAKARGAEGEESVAKPGDESAFVTDVVGLAVELSSFAPDAIAGMQFVDAVCVALTSTMQPSKALLMAAMTISECFQQWPKMVRKNDSMKVFSSRAASFRQQMENFVADPPPLFDEEEFFSRVDNELERREEAVLKRKALVSSKSKGFYDEKIVLERAVAPELAAQPPQLALTPPPVRKDPTHPPGEELDAESVAGFLDNDDVDTPLEMPGNPLMRTVQGLSPISFPVPADAVDVLSPSSSSSGDTDAAYLKPPTLFQAVDFLEVSRARSEAALMRSGIAMYFKSCTQSEMFLKESTVIDMFSLISSPFQSKMVVNMPEFKKSVQRIRTVLKLVHIAASCIKAQIRVVGKTVFHSSKSAVACLSVLFESLRPLNPPIEGDIQLQIMHETIRMSHFCDIMELFRMFCREKLLTFLADSNLTMEGTQVDPVLLLLERFSHDGILNLFLSLLGAELVNPRAWFSDRNDVIASLLVKMRLPPDDDPESDRQGENASQALKKIVSSLDHVHLNSRLIELHEQLYKQAFSGIGADDSDTSWSEKRFRYSIRVLSDWALMTLGKFRTVDERTMSECIGTTINYLPMVKKIVLNSYPGAQPSRVGFVRLECINFLAALVNARNPRIDEAILDMELLTSLLSLFFSSSTSSLLHSHITEFILVPICEEQSGKLFQGLIGKCALLDRIINNFVNIADPEHPPPPEFNGFLSVIAVAVSKSGGVNGQAEWDSFVRTKLLPTIKLQSRDTMGVPKTDEQSKRRPVLEDENF